MQETNLVLSFFSSSLNESLFLHSWFVVFSVKSFIFKKCFLCYKTSVSSLTSRCNFVRCWNIPSLFYPPPTPTLTPFPPMLPLQSWPTFCVSVQPSDSQPLQLFPHFSNFHLTDGHHKIPKKAKYHFSSVKSKTEIPTIASK